jgi:ATP-dependent helicase/nuclease subunit A
MLPLDEKPRETRKKYITKIADKISDLINNEHFSPSDIMVLVQNRRPFAAPLISELESRGIPVAGSDRIILPEFPAVADLLNLMRFCANVADDYMLACVLKSPLFGFVENDLFDIFASRGDRTGAEILRAKFPDAAAELDEIIGWSRDMGVYDFLMRVLATNNRRAKMIAAMGRQIIDPLEVFLSQALAYQRTRAGGLQSFLYWFITGNAEIKRDMDAASGVRVMTTHGAKGLDARVVFLIDTARGPAEKTRHGDFVNIEGGWLWSPGGGKNEKYRAARDAELEMEYYEYYRLLYVAMTRARDRLYVYGCGRYKTLDETSWHAMLGTVLGTTND